MSSKGPADWSALDRYNMRELSVHDRSTDTDPAVPPAAAKQAIVAAVGVLPGLFTVTRGSSAPVARPTAAE